MACGLSKAIELKKIEPHVARNLKNQSGRKA